MLFSIGLVFMSIADRDVLLRRVAAAGARCRRTCAARCISSALDFGVYRIFLIVVVAALTLALQYLIERTRFGSQVRASVDNATAAAGLGINVNRVFALTFALGSGLAGLGRRARHRRARASTRRFRSSTWCISCWSSRVGGAGTIKGPLVAALILGVFDVAGKYYVPQIGGFVIYALMVVLLILFPAGLYGRRV